MKDLLVYFAAVGVAYAAVRTIVYLMQRPGTPRINSMPSTYSGEPRDHRSGKIGRLLKRLTKL